MKLQTLINTDRPKLDINDKYLPEGNYTYTIHHFGNNGVVTGYVEGTIYDSSSTNKPILKQIKEEYIFKYYSVIQMMAKAQSQVARRARTISAKRIETLNFNSIPDYPSPSNLPGLMKNIVIETSESSNDGSPDSSFTQYRMSPEPFTLMDPPRRNSLDNDKRKLSLSKCMICLNGSNLDKILECGHKYHYHCINRWFSECEKTCPVCRSPIKEI